MMEKQLIVLLIISCACHVAFAVYSSAEFRNVSETEYCEYVTKPITCNATDKYRSICGVCNNLRIAYLGAANTRLNRDGRARYGDGLSTPPKSITGAELPSPRLISLKVFNDRNVPDNKLTVTTMQFGQFVAHDLGDGVDGMTSSNDCCTSEGLVSPNATANCFNIPIPSDDPVHINQQCIGFTRHFRNIDTKCAQCGVADQINRVTSFLDLSLNYGNNDEENDDVRSGVDGKFKMDLLNGQEWPPHDPAGGCFQENPNITCFHAGDPRVNVVPQLTILHILFMREHNRIADALKKLNPTWDDKKLFQEARRICIAEYQYIAYYQWLPQLLGKDNLKKAGLYFSSSGSSYSDDYNEYVDPSVYNEFTAGAFRFFHTQIEGSLNDVCEGRRTTKTTRLSDVFFTPAILLQGDTFQSKCRGMTYQSAESRDRHYDAEIRSYFLRNGKPFGDDLKAIDIQRDRDHGLPSYNEMRKLAGLPKARKWSDFSDWISSENIERLKSVYARFEDVDFSVGGALERPYDSTVGHGPTYHYVLMNQFYTSRAGDRFWFEFNNSPGAFTPQQLKEIRKSTLARIICDNSGGIRTMQRNVFMVPDDEYNAIYKCKYLPIVNLSLWKE